MFVLREHSLLSLIIFVSRISDLPSPRVVLINESSTHRGFKVRLRIYLRFAFRLDIASPVLVVLSSRSFLVSFVFKRRHRPDRVSCLMEPFPGKISGRREGEDAGGGGGSVISLDVRWQHCRSRSDIFRIEKRRN